MRSFLLIDVVGHTIETPTDRQPQGLAFLEGSLTSKVARRIEPTTESHGISRLCM